VSLLTQIFNFLGLATYNASPPTVGNAQVTSLQCDANGRLLVSVAAVNAGAPILAMPVATTGRIISTPGLANGYQVSAPFNSSGGLVFYQHMPRTPVRGMRVTVMDSGGFAAITPGALEDDNGYRIQSPMNPASLSTILAFSWSGFAATWEFITNDPTNGSFWQVVRSLQ
jgi:hypothetical protein